MTEFSPWRPHPWHGLSAGSEPPRKLNAFIEITPFDGVKYEIDKESGYIHVDRPQRTSALPPSLYGFLPKTYAGPRVSKLMPGAKCGDGDPLDVCVISEKRITRGGIILHVRLVGGLPMLDDGEADDKLVAVLQNDNVWGEVDDIGDLPPALIDSLRHYFTTYKMLPGSGGHAVTVGEAYGYDHAALVVEAAMADYRERFQP